MSGKLDGLGPALSEKLAKYLVWWTMENLRTVGESRVPATGKIGSEDAAATDHRRQ